MKAGTRNVGYPCELMLYCRGQKLFEMERPRALVQNAAQHLEALKRRVSKLEEQI